MVEPRNLRATPAPDGRPPHPDGDTIPHPPRPTGPPVTRRQWAAGIACAVIVLVALVFGVLRG